MAFHRGNAFLTNATADNLRTSWSAWFPTLNDPYASIVIEPLTHAKFFNTKNMVVLSLHLTVSFKGDTPSPYTTIAVNLPSTLKIRSNTSFKNQCTVERVTGTSERHFAMGMFTADGQTQGGVDGETFLFLDRIFVKNLGQYIAGQSYIIKGQIVFEPSA
jgi:hypothetical protein